MVPGCWHIWPESATGPVWIFSGRLSGSRTATGVVTRFLLLRPWRGAPRRELGMLLLVKAETHCNAREPRHFSVTVHVHGVVLGQLMYLTIQRGMNWIELAGYPPIENRAAVNSMPGDVGAAVEASTEWCSSSPRMARSASDCTSTTVRCVSCWMWKADLTTCTTTLALTTSQESQEQQHSSACMYLTSSLIKDGYVS